MREPWRIVALKKVDTRFSCDACLYQEDGRHYCLKHSITIKNMDIVRCNNWIFKEDPDNYRHSPTQETPTTPKSL